MSEGGGHSPVELLRHEHAVVVVEVLVVELSTQRQRTRPQGPPGQLPGPGGWEGDVMTVLGIMISLSEHPFILAVDIFFATVIFLRVELPVITKIFFRGLGPELRDECRVDVLIFNWSQLLSAVGRTSESINCIFTRISQIVHTTFRSSLFNGLQIGFL